MANRPCIARLQKEYKLLQKVRARSYFDFSTLWQGWDSPRQRCTHSGYGMCNALCRSPCPTSQRTLRRRTSWNGIMLLKVLLTQSMKVLPCMGTCMFVSAALCHTARLQSLTAGCRGCIPRQSCVPVPGADLEAVGHKSLPCQKGLQHSCTLGSSVHRPQSAQSGRILTSRHHSRGPQASLQASLSCSIPAIRHYLTAATDSGLPVVQYPYKPPSIQMFTPSGRFQTNTKLCLSMTDFHPGVPVCTKMIMLIDDAPSLPMPGDVCGVRNRQASAEDARQ